MSACKTLVRTSLFSLRSKFRPDGRTFSFSQCRALCFASTLSRRYSGLVLGDHKFQTRSFSHALEAAIPLETEKPTNIDELGPEDETSKDFAEKLLLHDKNDVARFMKMKRKGDNIHKDAESLGLPDKWFPYLDLYEAGGVRLSSGEVLEAMDPYIMELRKEKFRSVVRNRTYSVCLVVEGLSDYGNVSAAFRSADALGFQSVHVISPHGSKRYKDNRHVSMGAEKWLDIELWNSTKECFEVLNSRGYRIATTHVGMDAVSVYEMDWSCPTAIVVGNENKGISEDALELSDMHCSIPMKGMVDSFNVSVAAGILMHHAVCDRISCLGVSHVGFSKKNLRISIHSSADHHCEQGCHGDLTSSESQILLAEFSLRHNSNAISIANEYAKRKRTNLASNL